MAEEGTVKWFSDQRGYGFIGRDNGEDVFVHHSSIVGEGFKTLKEGDRVSFEMDQNDKGPRAKDVTKITGASSDTSSEASGDAGDEASSDTSSEASGDTSSEASGDAGDEASGDAGDEASGDAGDDPGSDAID